MLDLFLEFIKWFYFKAPKDIFKIWQNFILFGYNFFSIGLFLKTYFYPWRYYQIQRERGFNFKNFLEVHIFNLFSRLIGFTIKSLIIILGIFAESLIIFTGISIILIWLFLPILIILGFYKAFQLL